MTDWLGTFLAISARNDIGERLYQAEPAWAWSRDGAELAWANPAGARLLGKANLDELAALNLPEKQNLRRDIANVARTLAQGATLARLRFYKGARTLPLACQCERLRIGGGRTLILVSALEAAAGKAESSDADLAAFMNAGAGSTYVLDQNGHIMARHGDAVEGADFSVLAEMPGEVHSETIADGLCARHVTVTGAKGPRILVWADNVADAGLSLETAETADEIDIHGADEAAEEFSSVVAPEQDESEIAASGSAAGSAPGRAEDSPEEPDLDDGDLQDQNLSEQARILRSALRIPPGSETDEAPADGAWPHALDKLPQKPVRFLWQTDADDRFLFVSPGLEQLVGRSSQIVGERWIDIARRMRLDPVGRIGQALAARDTWSGFTAWWPAEDHSARIPAELTALPVFAMDQSFQGYRGFGVLKPAEALSEEAFDRRFPGIPDNMPETVPPSPPASPRLSAPAQVVIGSGADAKPDSTGNVVPIRDDIEHLPDFARLSPQERSAFEEIASALRTPHEAGRIASAAYQGARQDASETPDAGEVEPAVDEEVARAAREPADGHVLADEVASGADRFPQSNAPEDDEVFSTDAEDPAFLASLPDDDDDYPPDIDDSYPDDFEAVLDAESETGESADDRGEDEVHDADEVREEIEVEEDEDGDRDDPAAELIAPQPANDDQLADSDEERDDEAPVGNGDLAEAERRIEELTAILDTATDGVVIIDNAGLIQGLNASAQALFDEEETALAGTPFADLLADDSRQAALDYLDGLRDNGVASVLNEGREVGTRSGEGLIPLFMTLGRISGSGEDARFCAVVRDISQWKRTEAELIAGRKSAEKASEQKSDFLARVSHEIRTPLNAIIGFAEVMIEERFGPVENDRYREYLRDIRTSGEHVVSLVNDLLDISKIEAGKLDLTFAAVPLNDLVRECVALMQPQANRAQVIVRSSLAAELPAIVADPRTMRQVVLNLLSNSVKFTGSGGQVIVSTTLAETGEAILRVRDTGSGMSEEDLARALEPFRQLSTSRIGDENGTGLGLPLTKALVEANRAEFSISSARGEGTIVQVTFPATRVLSE